MCVFLQLSMDVVTAAADGVVNDVVTFANNDMVMLGGKQVTYGSLTRRQLVYFSNGLMVNFVLLPYYDAQSNGI